jgi:hypothetical protein
VLTIYIFRGVGRDGDRVALYHHLTVLGVEQGVLHGPVVVGAAHSLKMAMCEMVREDHLSIIRDRHCNYCTIGLEEPRIFLDIIYFMLSLHIDAASILQQ